MACSSSFWAQMVIWTGRDPTPLSRIREYVKWSRERLLHIYVIRWFDPSTEDRMEKAQVKVITELLLPHMNRWAVLSMKLLHASSLPCPRFDLVGHAENLVQLDLDFIVDDVVSRPTTALSPSGEFDTPKLEKLSMGGVHFRESYVVPFPQLPTPPQLHSVALTGYASPRVPFAPVDLMKALLPCHKLRSVHLENLQLDIGESDQSSLLWLNEFIDTHFGDMSGDVVEECERLLCYPSSEQASYIHCSMPTRAPPAVEFEHGASYVDFIDIASPTTLVHYLTHKGTSAHVVTIKHCSGLQAEVLHALAKPTTMDLQVPQRRLAGGPRGASQHLGGNGPHN
ncbi:uncharacterized protein C8Q71DRAFT_181680 [Rhodofomes roseus]|uniref:F-box domain-containing protein n=1 Tax=Rhodofomes roseus TaxID=34475 RepID=A0ABQ8K8L3_9APHY|nr:uncharacterized protein C8Q71DRAFT_181680 [Rhodofomes roseus]KAH9833415.1 hypothetical protein C8Q71DRAFT_181680 [Rhodofomes roseus]